ncbi:MAG: DUF1684 domain-containing protein [Chloroflexota bacterium]
MLDLLDYRRRVADLYQTVRDSEGDEETWHWFRYQREWLFRTHPRSALDEAQKAAFRELPYFSYNPDYRVIAEVNTQVEPAEFAVDLGSDGTLRYKRIGSVAFDLPTGSGLLYVYWILGYGGGLFLPFGDATNGSQTFGGGRYLYDTIKGADLGTDGHTIVLDFNYAYNPSCAYNSRWVCPLTPPENRLPFPVEAGELNFPGIGA